MKDIWTDFEDVESKTKKQYLRLVNFNITTGLY